MTVRGDGHRAARYCLGPAGVVLDHGLMKAMTLDRDRSLPRVEMGAAGEVPNSPPRNDSTGRLVKYRIVMHERHARRT